MARSGKNNRHYQFDLTPTEPSKTYQLKNVTAITGWQVMVKNLVQSEWVFSDFSNVPTIAEFQVKLENALLMDNFENCLFWHPTSVKPKECYHEINNLACNVTVEARNFDQDTDSHVLVNVFFDQLMGTQ